MSGVFSDDGIKDALAGLHSSTDYTGAKLHLLKGAVTFDNTLTAATCNAQEADFTGYSAQSVGAWSAPTVTSHVASSFPGLISFTITAGNQDIYGWYLTDAAGTKLLQAQADPDPSGHVNISSTGINVYSVQLTELCQDVNT